MYDLKMKMSNYLFRKEPNILDNAFVVDTTGLTNLRATALKIAKKASPVKSDKKI